MKKFLFITLLILLSSSYSFAAVIRNAEISDSGKSIYIDIVSPTGPILDSTFTVKLDKCNGVFPVQCVAKLVQERYQVELNAIVEKRIEIQIKDIVGLEQFIGQRIALTIIGDEYFDGTGSSQAIVYFQ